MSKRVEQRALEALPPRWRKSKYGDTKIDSRLPVRKFYIRAYEQAERDLALTWEDMRRISRILDIMVDDDFKGEIPEEWGEEEYYEEVLRRFNKLREE